MTLFSFALLTFINIMHTINIINNIGDDSNEDMEGDNNYNISN